MRTRAAGVTARPSVKAATAPVSALREATVEPLPASTDKDTLPLATGTQRRAEQSVVAATVGETWEESVVSEETAVGGRPVGLTLAMAAGEAKMVPYGTDGTATTHTGNERTGGAAVDFLRQIHAEEAEHSAIHVPVKAPISDNVREEARATLNG